MKTSTVNGVTYELPEGWEPIKSVPIDTQVNVLFANGRIASLVFYGTTGDPYPYIAWQHIVAPKVMPWKPKEGHAYWCVMSSHHQVGIGTWHEDACDCRAHHLIGNCYPTQAAAEAARERVIAAHTGGAKWKGGV